MATPLDDANGAKRFDRLSDIAREPLSWLLPIEGHEKVPLVSLEKAIEPLLNIVADIKRKAFVAKQNCANPADGLSPDESASIGLYTMEWEPYEKCLYFSLNNCLRDKQRENLKPWYLFLKLFLTGLEKLPTMSSTIVYRGVKTNLMDRYKLDSTFVWWGFSSCTMNLNTLQSEKFLGKIGDRILFAIECHSGKNITQHSYYQYENEILLLPARHFTVTGCLDQGNGLYMIQLKETEPPIVLIEPVSVDKNSSISSSSNPADCPVSTDNQNSKLDGKINKYQCSDKVNLTFADLADRDMPLIANQIIMFNVCTEIDLSNNHITSKGVLTLATILRKNTTLKALSLLSNYISDEGIHALAESLIQNSTLTMLGLGSNDITDEGAKYLSQMLRYNQTLTSLTLQQNKIGSGGVELFMDALHGFNKKLQILNVSSNTLINDSCVESVIRMFARNQTLKEFYMIRCSLSSTGIKKIQQATKSKRGLDLHLA